MQLRNLFARRPRLAAGLLAAASLEAGPDPAPVPAPPPARPEPRVERHEFAQSLWGEGFVGPGGGAEIMRLAAPFGASAASSLLVLGVAAGGPPCVLATETGAWVFGADTDPARIALATIHLNHAAPTIAKRATAKLWTPSLAGSHRRAFHHAIAVDLLRQSPAAALLPGLVGAVRPGGQIVLQELVRTDPPTDPPLAAWCRLEDRSPAMATEAEITAQLTALGLDIRIVEDQSARHARQVLHGWQQHLAALAGRPSRADAAMMVVEAEMWFRRLRLLQGGRLRLLRWHAIVPD